jgi:hypothetical protein
MIDERPKTKSPETPPSPRTGASFHPGIAGALYRDGCWHESYGFQGQRGPDRRLGASRECWFR